MRKQRFILIVAIATVLLVSAGGVEARTLRTHSYFGRGHSTYRPTVSSRYGTSITWRSRHRPIVSIGCATPVVQRHISSRYGYRSGYLGSVFHSRIAPSLSYVSSIVISPSRTYVAPLRTVAPTVITVWIRNSNGSQSPVELTRSGPGYIGPRGEYYSSMPNNEQLRIAYGL